MTSKDSPTIAGVNVSGRLSLCVSCLIDCCPTIHPLISGIGSQDNTLPISVFPPDDDDCIWKTKRKYKPFYFLSM